MSNSFAFVARASICRALVSIGHRSIGRGDVVVHRRDGEIRAADAAPGEPEGFERLRARHLVDEMEVDVEQIRLTGRPMHDVAVPDLLGQCLRFGWRLGHRHNSLGADPQRGSLWLFHLVEQSSV